MTPFLDVSTPFLVVDLATVADRYHRFRAALPGVRPYYAMKCNSSPEILSTLADLGGGFEVASLGELEMLQRIGVDPADVLYSNPIKPPSHVAAAHAAGLWRFSFDSPGELHKLALHAPGSSVYLRLRVDDSHSTFPLSRKFGASFEEAADLLRLALSLGLRPYGVTFHVGSQSVDVTAWRRAVASVGRLMSDLGDITLTMLNIGGGFPARYVDGVPGIEEIGAALGFDQLPYRPELLAAEPGRHLVAESGVMVATVLGRESRAGENWVYLDVGAYNGLMETAQTGGRWEYPLWTSRCPSAVTVPFTVTGPSCDSSDTMFYGVQLPADLEEGDRVYIGSAGAYTLSYASGFNGFPPPTPLFVNPRSTGTLDNGGVLLPSQRHVLSRNPHTDGAHSLSSHHDTALTPSPHLDGAPPLGSHHDTALTPGPYLHGAHSLSPSHDTALTPGPHLDGALPLGSHFHGRAGSA